MHANTEHKYHYWLCCYQHVIKQYIQICLVQLHPNMFGANTATLIFECDGRCKTLDASADGYVRAEAVACAILVPAATLTPDQATTAVLLRGSAVGQDGRSSSLTAPNGPSQQQAIRAAVQDAHEALQLSHLQMHGTGTPLGGEHVQLARVYTLQSGHVNMHVACMVHCPCRSICMSRGPFLEERMLKMLVCAHCSVIWAHVHSCMLPVDAEVSAWHLVKSHSRYTDTVRISGGNLTAYLQCESQMPCSHLSLNRQHAMRPCCCVISMCRVFTLPGCVYGQCCMFIGDVYR